MLPLEFLMMLLTPFLFSAYIFSVQAYKHKLLVKYADYVVLSLAYSYNSPFSTYVNVITELSQWSV